MFEDDNLEEQKRNSSSTEFNIVLSTPEKLREPDHPDITNSMFGDGSCGEPFVSQHVVLDFTPDEEVDNDFVQKKCCAFWDFIRSQPEFKDWLTLPKSDENVTMSSNSESIGHDASDRDQIESDETLKSPTAVAMLEFVEKKGVMDQMFESKLQQSHCSLGSREYEEGRHSTAQGLRTRKYKRSAGGNKPCKCRGSCERCKKRVLREPAPSPSSPEVRALCEQMNDWDSSHPKSMEPPGHPPALPGHPPALPDHPPALPGIMKRKVIT